MASSGALARVWDAPVRLFHWLLVGLIAFSWWSGEHHDMDWHRRSGYAILGLLIFRLYWGVVGSSTARFAGFVRGPRAVWTYLRGLRRGGHAGLPGHNPAGGWSVVLMLGTVAAMVTAGLFSIDVDGLESGPLADYVSFDTGRWAAGWHGVIFNVLLALIALHVIAIVFYLIALRHNVLTPMIHGKARVSEIAGAEPVTAPIWKVALGIVIAGAMTYAISIGFHF